MSAGPDPAWSRACLAAALVALDPAGAGTVLRARPGPVREAWLDRLRALLPAGAAVTRLPAGIADDALLGGLDLPATLRTGRPVAQAGLAARSHGGVMLVPMAERLTPGTAARLAQALDAGAVEIARDGVTARYPARFGLVLLDEGEGEDETVPACLADRAAFHLDLDAVPVGAITAAPPPLDLALALALARAADPGMPAEAADTLCALAARLGIASLRAPLLALRVARLHAALDGRAVAAEPDLAAAAALVLAPRARTWPPDDEEESAPPPVAEIDRAGEPASGPDDDDRRDDHRPVDDDRILAAAAASLPPGLLARLVSGVAPRTRSPGAGRAGAAAAAQRGRPIGVRPGDPRRGRLALIETLRAAAPWQRLRRGDGEARLRITAQDLRIRRLVQRRETTTIFAVDASGSAALERLAEAKGAVEQLLAECYVRRDRVALVAFRGGGADLLLVPTRSLVRAKRALAALPGGGGTPLAAGIAAAGRLAAAERRGGRSPVVLLLTDGRANIDRAGRPGRAQAGADALAAARALAAEGIPGLVIDTAARPQDAARALAAAMGARYLPMPQADAARLAKAVREVAPAA
ncbi:magnesium chelatase [Methylobacterium indicum]|uniref:magnesium chelatase subunit D n=1 Tax=Methylobacterium indicum TaxID=1775910 RepID=UPI0007341B8C|nr:magnesium chelatase subunit D [Methylobacterium indicum]KTS38730.1 magnesium chelatase [Methylobacterium indicum]KTS38961.1 magnesium chelatase [Methylobacterium indicum]KTS54947.1 magnesium chelatase [Methylobacterium indicum]